MSIYISIDEDEPDMFASNTGWGDVVSWSNDLDPDSYPDLLHLFTHGWDDTPAKCAKQLVSAVSDSPPEDETVVSTLKNLLTVLQSADPDAVVTINNGMSAS